MFGQLTKDELLAFRLVDVIFAVVADQGFEVEKGIELVELAKKYEEIILNRDTLSVMVNTACPSTGKPLKFKAYLTPSELNLQGDHQARQRFLRAKAQVQS